MGEHLSQTPDWFLRLSVIGLGSAVTLLIGGLLWSIRETLKDIKDDLRGLFARHDDHERRLSKLEGAHAAKYGE